jgi:PLP dependent protein
MTNLSIAQRLAKIQETLPASVRLIAVSKQVSADAIREAYSAGVRDFGESRVQEAAQKQDQLQDLSDITWHLIGHLQSNKAKMALERFHWIHSVDRLSLAQELDRLIERGCPQRSLLLQVKLKVDPHKFGWMAADLLADLPILDRLEHLKIQGLMTIPPLGLTPAETQSLFQETQRLAEHIRTTHCSRISMEQLSMGMSDDYPLAITEGATAIRLGRILFGDRSNSKRVMGNG